MRRLDPTLTRFENAATLLAHLTSPDRNLDEKDQIYTALVRVVQARGFCARLAHALVWGGLWPGLDRVYRRRLRHFVTEPEELCQAISFTFTTLVETMDLGRVRRVASTLVRSTDREVTEGRLRMLHEIARRANDRNTATSVSKLAAPTGSADARTPTGAFADELTRLRDRILPLIGADTDLVLAVVVLDMDQHEAATQFGLSHEAARKRLQRALARLRAHLRTTPDAGAGT